MTAWNDLPGRPRDLAGPGWGRRLATVTAAVVGIGVVGVGGSRLPVEKPAYDPGVVTSVGRTTTVCTVAQQPSGQQPTSSTTLSAVATRQAPGRTGLLTGAPLAGGPAELTVKSQGFGAQVSQPQTSVVLAGEGVMATASTGTIFTFTEQGEQSGLMAAPCTAPVTSQWFVGVGADDQHRSELVLSNPDDAQAEVDLRFYGEAGLVVVPGSPGLIVPAHSTRTVALAPLVNRPGPLSVLVRATQGRVSAMSRDLYSQQLKPAGADWHAASASPNTNVVIPGMPEGEGARDLVVTNPGTHRALVTVSVLGVQGAFSPAGAETLEVGGESTATISLGAGLAGQPAGIQLASDHPVTAAVISTATRLDPNSGVAAQPDIAIQPAAQALGRTGVAAMATTDSGDSELMLSNGSDTDAQLSFDVLSLDGVVLRTDDVFVAAHSTSTRRLNSPAPSYLLVRVPAGPAIYGAIVLTRPDGPIAGLATVPILSPDVASRAPQVVPDAAVAR